MDINVTKNDNQLTIALTGRLDTSTASELDASLAENLPGVTDLTFDFTNLDYISSAGLRSLLATQKKMNAVDGKMAIKNANDIIKEAFEITGFIDILTLI